MRCIESVCGISAARLNTLTTAARFRWTRDWLQMQGRAARRQTRFDSDINQSENSNRHVAVFRFIQSEDWR